MKLAAIIVAAILLLGGGAYVGVNRIAQAATYHPVTAEIAPELAGVEAVRIGTADGETLVAWRRAADPGQPTFLFFHGNGSSPATDSARWEMLAARGAGFLAPAYRGYAGSTGAPSEGGLREDARAAYAWLIEGGVGADEIVIHGFSLGSAVAARLASERPARALVLEAPMTAIVDLAADAAPSFVPMRLLMRDQFRTRDVIGDLTMPLLIVHGDADQTVPFAMGEQLFAAAREPKRFARIEGGAHSLPPDAVYAEIWDFLEQADGRGEDQADESERR